MVLARTHTIPAAVINGLLDAPIDREAVDRSPTTLRALLAWSDTNTDRLLTSVAAVTAAARVDPEQVAEQVRAAVAEELSKPAHHRRSRRHPCIRHVDSPPMHVCAACVLLGWTSREYFLTEWQLRRDRRDARRAVERNRERAATLPRSPDRSPD